MPNVEDMIHAKNAIKQLIFRVYQVEGVLLFYLESCFHLISDIIRYLILYNFPLHVNIVLTYMRRKLLCFVQSAASAIRRERNFVNFVGQSSLIRRKLLIVISMQTRHTNHRPQQSQRRKKAVLWPL